MPKTRPCNLLRVRRPGSDQLKSKLPARRPLRPSKRVRGAPVFVGVDNRSSARRLVCVRSAIALLVIARRRVLTGQTPADEPPFGGKAW